jgi:hypothetical protein
MIGFTPDITVVRVPRQRVLQLTAIGASRLGIVCKRR